MQGYGIGQNKPATFHAEDLISSDTYVKLRYDVSYGNGISTTSVHSADSDGTFAYTLSMNGTLQKCDIYMPVDMAVGVNRRNENFVSGLPETANVPMPANVYSINGSLIRANATTLVGLPSGIYIWGGKKVLVK